MELYQIVLIIVAAIVALVILQLTLTAILVNAVVFGNRSDKKPHLKYFTAEDFGLETFPVEILRGKYKLRGFVYTAPEAAGRVKDTVVFCHGMGPGHIAYTTEIAYFCRAGYRVVAVDSLGCNFSEGKKIGGFFESVLAARLAVRYAKNAFSEGKIFLVGHSLGAYSALCATKWEKVDKVVAISAPESPLKAIAGRGNGFLFAVTSPFLAFVFFMKYGASANMRASKAIEKSGVPALIIHGEKDKDVALKHSAYYYSEGRNVEKYLAEGKRHNPYNTVAAEDKLAELMSVISPEADEQNETLLKAFFDSFDFAAATEEDGAVMQKIADFLVEC